MNLARLAALALALAFVPGMLFAQAPNDTWEPNNTIGAAKQIQAQHFSPTCVWGNLFNSPTLNEQLMLPAGDADCFTIPGAPAGDVTIYAMQTSVAPATANIGLEIYDGMGVLLCGPSSGAAVYKQLRTDGSGTSGTMDPYNGAAATATLAVTGNITVRLFVQGGTVPAMTSMNYEWTLEFSTTTVTPDASEGNFTNNFFTVNTTDATPAGTGSPRTTTLATRTFTGFDYYKVTLPISGRIQVTISNYPTMAGANQCNFDLFWVSGDPNQAVPYGILSFDGASDTFPPPNFNMQFPPAAINATETLTTVPLAAGTYYFHVLAWVQLAGPQLGFYYAPGNYDIAFTCTNVADDVYDTSPNNNDTAATAVTLPAGQYTNLRMHFGDTTKEEDWYKVSIASGGTLEVQLNHTAPTTDDFNLELYKPNTTTPGVAADLIDAADIDNNNTTLKGTSTAKEIVGTWGTVGSSGDTGLPAGDYLIRVRVSGTNLPQDCRYSLTIYVNGAAGALTLTPVDVAPEDTREPNDSIVEARASNNCRLPAGLTQGLRAMDGEDWYKIATTLNRSVEITLVYVAAADVDLDVELYDLNTGGTGALSDWTLGLMDSDYAFEAPGLRRVTITATTGDAYQALTPPQTGPGSGDIFIRVKRWASRGVAYGLNININNANPLSPLQINTVAVTPPKTLDASVSGSIQVTVNISNTAATGMLDVTTLTLKLTHALGADVTAEYTVTAPSPTLPATINAGTATPFTFTVTGNPSTTSGQIRVSATAQSGTNKIPGDPLDTFTVTGGVAPVPQLAYTIIRASAASNLKPSGVLVLEVQINNILGRATGTYNAPAAIDFTLSGAPINSQFTLSGAPNPALPITIAVGQTRTVTWTYAILPTAPLGTVTVTLTGGGADNPVSGNGTFNITNGGSTTTPGGGGGCSTADQQAMPLGLCLAAFIPFAVAALRRRKRA